MGQSIPVEAGRAFKQRMAERIGQAGAGLERHFPQLNPGDGVALLRHSYALIIGLWQMSAASAKDGLGCPLAGDDTSPVFNYSYPAELDRALLALWSGTIAGATAATAATAEHLEGLS
jgi:hypothetical protein